MLRGRGEDGCGGGGRRVEWGVVCGVGLGRSGGEEGRVGVVGGSSGIEVFIIIRGERGGESWGLWLLMFSRCFS